MKHDRFIELLNLYLDGELSREDSVDLEREITTNPERRKIYREYCQMQRACSILSEKFRDSAETPETSADGKVVQFPARKPSVTWARGFSLVAAGAAAAAVVFVAVQSGFTAKSPDSVATSTKATVPAAPRELAIPVTALADANRNLQPVFQLQSPAGSNSWLSEIRGVTNPNVSGTAQSLFSAVPPLPDYQTPQTIRVDFRGGIPAPLVIEPLRFQEPENINAFQFPR